MDEARIDTCADLLGTVTLAPHAPVAAGQVDQWTLTYTVGAFGIDEGGTIKIAHRFASDWEPPQFDRPGESGYTTIRTDGAAKLIYRFDRKGHVRPWMKCLVIDVTEGHLEPGDKVYVVLGDRCQGSPGIRAQTFQERAHEIRVFVDPTNACHVRPIRDCPTFPILPATLESLVVTIPSQATVGSMSAVNIRGEDRLGNPTPPPPNVVLRWTGSGEAEVSGTKVTPTSKGIGRIAVDHGGSTYFSNPMAVTEEPGRWSRFWGDLHAQSGATIGTGTEEEYFTFARDMAWLDFTSHQANDFQITDGNWREFNETVKAFHRDGEFVVFPGYEWSAATSAGGDRNVFYLHEGEPLYRSSAWQLSEATTNDLTPTVPVTALLEQLKKMGPERVLSGAHVGGRYADISRGFDEVVGPLIEVVSCWGVFEWLLWDALEAGHRVAVMCNSDGHKGRPGAEGPGAGEFGIGGGLTCVLAESKTREAIFQALRERRCYGTTGARIILDFMINGRPMGSEVRANGPVSVHAHAAGSTAIERLILMKGRETVQEVLAPAFNDTRSSRRVRVSWRGARFRGRSRRVTWDGTISANGTKIVQAQPHSFDSPGDGLSEVTERQIRFRSKTTGDVDGVDIWLENPRRGTLTMQSNVGKAVIDLSTLETDPIESSFGGLDMAIVAQRYPEQCDTLELNLQTTIAPQADRVTPYLVKAVQCDGQTAWSSPIYVQTD